MEFETNFKGIIDVFSYDEVVSLGGCCEPTFLIRNFKLSKLKKSYPFDWVSINSIQEVARTINNDFEQYLEKYIKKNIITNIYQLFTKHYDIVIPHHSDEEFKKMFSEKIDNLRNLFKSEMNVLFILKCHKHNRCTPEEAINIITTIRSKAPKLSFTLFIVIEYENEEIEVEKNIMSFPQECKVVYLKGIIRCDDEQHDFWKQFGFIMNEKDVM